MTAVWLGVISALAGLVGAAIGGIASYTAATAQFANARRAKERRRRIAAMEDIYLLLTKAAGAAGDLSTAVVRSTLESIIKGGMHFEPGEWKEQIIEFDRLSMLVDFYVPVLNSDVEAINSVFNSIAKSIAEMVHRNIRGINEFDEHVVSKTMGSFLEASKLATLAQKKLGLEMHRLINER